MAESIKGLHGAFLLILVTFCTTNLLPHYQSFWVRGGQTWYSLHLGAGCKYNHQPAQSQGG
jgi:hypothetical protein